MVDCLLLFKVAGDSLGSEFFINTSATIPEIERDPAMSDSEKSNNDVETHEVFKNVDKRGTSNDTLAQEESSGPLEEVEKNMSPTSHAGNVSLNTGIANADREISSKWMQQSSGRVEKDLSLASHQELESFASYVNRNVLQDRRESMKAFRQNGTSSDRFVEEIEFHPASHFDADVQSEITTKADFARAAIERAERDDLIALLRRRSMHLPGNNWFQDWIQFIRNNHPLLGVCLHHHLHPLKFEQRIYILIASISFGLLATNLVFLYFVYSTEDFDDKVFRIYLEVRGGDYRPLEISQGMISLWATNGLLHALFDVSMWHLSACTCFQARDNFERLQKIGSYVVVAISGLITAFSSFFIVCRALVAGAEVLNGGEDGLKGFFFFEGYAFVIGYFIELCAVYFICYPLLVTVIFSGMFGCIPGMGGRPRDVERYLARLLNERNRLYGDFSIV